MRWRSCRHAEIMTAVGKFGESSTSLVSHASQQPTQVFAVPETCWYATYVCTHHERKVVRQLEERRVTCFLPVYRSVRRWKDRRKELDLVLFPGYVFVHIDLCNRLRVLDLPGVVRLVSCNGQPVAVPQQEIEALKDGLVAGVRAEPHPYLKVGRQVRVKHGPLQGLQGVLVRRKEGFRLVLSLDLIMRSIAVEVDEADVEPC